MLIIFLGSVYEKAEQNIKDLSGAAPPITKWTVFCIDLINLTKIYANRNYYCVRGYKLCANLLIKNVVTSDCLYEAGVTHAEARLHGNLAIPRELLYSNARYENWHTFYDYISFPAESFHKPFDSVGQSKIIINYNDFVISGNNVKKTKDAHIVTSYVQNHHETYIDYPSKPKKYTQKFKNGRFLH